MPRFLLFALLCLGIPAAQADDKAALWQSLRAGEAVALIRHAEALGNFDPPGFEFGDCGTQRNLSEAGRAQARALGDEFRRHGIRDALIYSSQWCRCLDTAAEMRLGPVEPLPALNSLHHERADAEAQTAAVRRLIREHRDRPLLLVTHQVNIARLAGTHAGSGEVIVVRPEGERLSVLGRLP